MTEKKYDLTYRPGDEKGRGIQRFKKWKKLDKYSYLVRCAQNLFWVNLVVFMLGWVSTPVFYEDDIPSDDSFGSVMKMYVNKKMFENSFNVKNVFRWSEYGDYCENVPWGIYIHLLVSLFMAAGTRSRGDYLHNMLVYFDNELKDIDNSIDDLERKLSIDNQYSDEFNGVKQRTKRQLEQYKQRRAQIVAQVQETINLQHA